MKEEKSSPSAGQAALGKTGRVFHEMLANLGREKELRQQVEHSPLRDETKRVLNSYYPPTQVMPQNYTERIVAHAQKDIWSSRLKKSPDENRVKIDIRKIESKEKSQKRLTTITPGGYGYRETAKATYKPPEKAKAVVPSKKVVADDKLRYDKGEFARYLERK
jgi:hypothetical protein